MPYEIFISYSHDNETLCERVSTLLTQMGYSVFVDRDALAAGPEWRLQLENVLRQPSVRPYVVLLATRAATNRPDEIRSELKIAEEAGLDIISIEFDVGAVKHLRGTGKYQTIEAHRVGADAGDHSFLEKELRKALNYRTKVALEKFRDQAIAWMNKRLPQVSFWTETWHDYFPKGDRPSSPLPASVALLARGGSGKSVLLAHCLKSLIHDPTVYPIVVDGELLKRATTEIPTRLGARTADDLPNHLEALAKQHAQHIVFVVDGLDQVIVPGDSHQSQLTKALNMLSNSAGLLISCRKELWDNLYAGRVSVVEKEVNELGVDLVGTLLAKKPHLKFDTANALLRIPFFLDLVLQKADYWEHLPATETDFLQRLWSDAVQENSTQRQGQVLPEDTGREDILNTLAVLQLEHLAYDVSKVQLKARTGLGDMFERGLQRLKDSGIVDERPSGLQGTGPTVRLRHDLFDGYSMVRVLLGADDSVQQCRLLCRRADEGCGWSVLSMLMRTLHDHGNAAFKRAMFSEFLFMLDCKKFSTDRRIMARAWAVTHILKECFQQLLPLILECLAGRFVEDLRAERPEDATEPASRLGPDACVTQATGSTLASAFMVLREGLVQDAQQAVPTFTKALSVWKYKARLVDALAKYRTRGAQQAIVDFGDRQLGEKDDPKSLLYVAKALKHFNDPAAIQLLQRIYGDRQLNSQTRRVAAESLHHLRPDSAKPPVRDDEEIIQELRIKEDKSDRYTDWHVVQDYADYVRNQARWGRPFGPQVLNALIGALDHDQTYVRRSVAHALMFFHDPRARDALLDELLEEVVPPEVREACLESLQYQLDCCANPRLRQSFRSLLLRAARVADQNSAAGTAQELTQAAVKRMCPADDWYADPHALEVVEPPPTAAGWQVACEIVPPTASPPIEPSVLEELQRSGSENTGPDQEPKYRFTEIVRQSDHTLRIQLAPTTWTLGKGFHNTLQKNSRRFLRRNDGSWIEPVPLGPSMLPGLAVVHVMVLTADGMLLMVQRSPKVSYAPLHWSASFEEQVTACDFTRGGNGFVNAARRGFLEEFGLQVPPGNISVLSAVLELDNLNLGLCLLLRPEATAENIRSHWLSEPRPTHHWEANAVDSMEAHTDLLKQVASGKYSSHEPYHPTSRIRCAILARWLKDQSVKN
jgi:hypothetical protein